MYKSFVRKISDKFLSHKKEEKKQFPIALKEKEILIQKSNFIKVKSLLEKSSNQKTIIDTAVDRQIEEYLLISRSIMLEAIDKKLNKLDVDFLISVQSYIYALSTSKKYEEKLDNLFRLYVTGALYIGKNNFSELAQASLGYSYAIRGIYNGFIMFIDAVEEI
jgi:hypothetical protein